MGANDKNSDGHFTGVGTCQIHTSKTGTCQRVGKGGGGCDYPTNCDPPHVTWATTAKPWKNDKGQTEWEAHHILCVEAVTRYRLVKAYSADEKKNIDAVYRKTEWCINQKPNMIALPRKMVYREYAESRGLNLPCHCWDHNIADGYIDDVREQIHLRIWQKIREAVADEVQCKLAKDVVVKELQDLADKFREILKQRGKRKAGNGAGTLAAWTESEKDSPAPQWWYPFSMARDAVAANRPANTFGKPKWSAKARLDAQRSKRRAFWG